MEAAELPLWLRALEPLSVPFVILLMLGGWLVEVRRERRQRRRADARLRARAFALAAILDEWFDVWPEWGLPDQIEKVDAERIERVTEKMVEHAPKAWDALEDMVETAPEASDELAEMAREVYPRLHMPLRHMEIIAKNVSDPEPNEWWVFLAPEVMASWHPEVIEVFNLLHPHTLEFREHTTW